MLKNIFLILFLTVLSVNAQGDGRNFIGEVVAHGEPLAFSRIYCDQLKSGVSTDLNGIFAFKNLSFGDYDFRISSMGFSDLEIMVKHENPSDTLLIDLSQNDIQLNEVVVSGTMRETMISKSPVKIEVLNANFFKSNPVNSVIEALETVNGVQEQMNCGVCATNDIHINGMEGPYTLVLIDGMPIVSGLSAVYGFNGIPTSLIERVEIIKGPSSTLYGTEAVGGVINIITKSPENSDLLNVDLRYTTHDELKTELSYAPKLNDRVYMSLSGDYYRNKYRMDYNNDGFTDIPLNNRLSVFNKWTVLSKDKEDKVFSIGARYLFEDRFGGKLDWTNANRGGDQVYGESIYTQRWEVMGHYVFPTQKRNLKLDFSANRHEQDSYYGDVNYGATQQVLFSNLIWENKIGKRHFLVSGLTNRWMTYEDNTPSMTDENAYIPGVFVQDEFTWSDDFVMLGGARLDHHQRHGFIFAPRFSIKKTFKTYTTVRANYGNGFRQVFLFTEDHAFVSGARDVVILSDLLPERSHNVTLNLNHTYTVGGYGNFDIDLFYMHFSNKIIPDFDTDPNLIIYDNLAGLGVSRGASLAINHKFKIPLRVKLGATFMDVYEEEPNELDGTIQRTDQVFAPKFSGVFGVKYQWNKLGITIDYTGRVVGPQRLPTAPDGFEINAYSDWFSLQHIQLTKTFKKQNIEIFGSVKNIFNYTQGSPLIDPQNPFGDSFDTAFAYGPLQVRRFFFGLRYGLKRK